MDERVRPREAVGSSILGGRERSATVEKARTDWDERGKSQKNLSKWGLLRIFYESVIGTLTLMYYICNIDFT